MNYYSTSMYYPFCTCERERISYNIDEPPILTLGIQHEIYNSIISGEEYEETTDLEEDDDVDYNVINNLQEEDDDYNISNDSQEDDDGYDDNNDLQDEDMLEQNYRNHTI